MRDALRYVILGILLAIIAGCGEDLRPAFIKTVSLPDSITGQGSMPVTVYTYRADCTVKTGSTQFVAVNDSTFELRVQQTSGTPGSGCPGGHLADQFVLTNLPARRFHVRIVGINTIEATVNGGTQPTSGVREEFLFCGQPPGYFDRLQMILLGCDPSCQDTLNVIQANQNGVAVFEGSCDLDGVRFRAETPDLDPFGIEFEGTFHCGVPWQTIFYYPSGPGESCLTSPTQSDGTR